MSDVCATHGAAYIERYGSKMPKHHRRVLQLLADCGTGRLGAASYCCAPCAAVGKPSLHFTNASCGNRHCPGCQTSANGEWCVAQTKKLLPCEYAFVTFTVPQELRGFIRSNQSLCYAAMFQAAAFALRKLMADPKFCGATRIGFTSVLHTFGGDLVYHPHIHVLMTCGGLNDTGEWKSTRPGFVLPVKKLSQEFRIEFERLVGDRANELGIPPADFRREFVSFAKPVGDGLATLKYLSRYMFRTAITNKRIMAMDDTHVTFSYRKKTKRSDAEPPGKGPVRTMRLPVLEFLRRFLQHVLPQNPTTGGGFQRVRHYGFLSRASKVDLDELRSTILQTTVDSEPDLELEEWKVPVLKPSTNDGPKCPTCGELLTFVSFIRIRPPPLEWRAPISTTTTTRFATRQN